MKAIINESFLLILENLQLAEKQFLKTNKLSQHEIDLVNKECNHKQYVSVFAKTYLDLKENGLTDSSNELFILESPLIILGRLI